ncbi:MAG: hypothetical protein ACJ8DI_16665, partial [Ktedonobacteraceae bacterium]
AKLEAEVLHNEPGASLPERHIAHRRRKRAVGQLPARRLSCVVRGKLILLAMQSQSQPLPVGLLQAEPWPEFITAPQKTASTFSCEEEEEENAKGEGSSQKTKTSSAGTFPHPQLKNLYL